jgi:hypothetical protein
MSIEHNSFMKCTASTSLRSYTNTHNSAEEKNDPVTPQSSAQKVDNNVYCSLHESKLSNLFFF